MRAFFHAGLLLASATLQASEVTVFKWRDAQGHWHYGEKAPKSPHQALTINTEANVTRGSPFRRPEKKTGSRPGATRHSAPDKSPESGMGLPYTPGGVQKMLDDIKDIEKAVGQRTEALDKF